eukprot:m.46971 g.46971  ORF g.46971 m.46971 type:complete len:722 (-) comp10432_c2_seq1:194-2359(-)
MKKLIVLLFTFLFVLHTKSSSDCCDNYVDNSVAYYHANTTNHCLKNTTEFVKKFPSNTTLTTTILPPELSSLFPFQLANYSFVTNKTIRNTALHIVGKIDDKNGPDEAVFRVNKCNDKDEGLFASFTASQYYSFTPELTSQYGGFGLVQASFSKKRNLLLQENVSLRLSSAEDNAINHNYYYILRLQASIPLVINNKNLISLSFQGDVGVDVPFLDIASSSETSSSAFSYTQTILQMLHNIGDVDSVAYFLAQQVSNTTVAKGLSDITVALGGVVSLSVHANLRDLLGWASLPGDNTLLLKASDASIQAKAQLLLSSGSSNDNSSTSSTTTNYLDSSAQIHAWLYLSAPSLSSSLSISTLLAHPHLKPFMDLFNFGGGGATSSNPIQGFHIRIHLGKKVILRDVINTAKESIVVLPQDIPTTTTTTKTSGSDSTFNSTNITNLVTNFLSNNGTAGFVDFDFAFELDISAVELLCDVARKYVDIVSNADGGTGLVKAIYNKVEKATGLCGNAASQTSFSVGIKGGLLDLDNTCITIAGTKLCVSDIPSCPGTPARGNGYSCGSHNDCVSGYCLNPLQGIKTSFLACTGKCVSKAGIDEKCDISETQSIGQLLGDDTYCAGDDTECLCGYCALSNGDNRCPFNLSKKEMHAAVISVLTLLGVAIVTASVWLCYYLKVCCFATRTAYPVAFNDKENEKDNDNFMAKFKGFFAKKKKSKATVMPI